MEKILVKCEKLDNFGRGIVKINNKIMFVKNLLPGEEAYIIKTLDKKNYMEGKIIEIIKKSPDKVEGKCKNEDCGCDLKHLKYSKQLEYKEEKLRNIFLKFLNMDNIVNHIIYGNKNWNYRNKVTLKVKGKCGYYKNKTHDFVPIERHELANEKINKIISLLNEENLSNVTEIVIKAYDEIMIAITGKMNIDNLKKHADSIYMNNICVYGKKYVYNHINNLKFLVGSEAFFQVNNEITEKLYKEVLNNIDGNNVLDLYCGTGTISLFLAQKVKNVLGIEINKDAVECANMNKKINNINNVNFICGDASKEIDKLSFKPDCIVVDPPRAGLTKQAIGDILKISPKKIIYVSCDPVTLARDIKMLNKYEVIKVTPFDMFPQTHHVECVSVLCRKTFIK